MGAGSARWSLDCQPQLPVNLRNLVSMLFCLGYSGDCTDEGHCCHHVSSHWCLAENSDLGHQYRLEFEGNLLTCEHILTKVPFQFIMSILLIFQKQEFVNSHSTSCASAVGLLSISILICFFFCLPLQHIFIICVLIKYVFQNVSVFAQYGSTYKLQPNTLNLSAWINHFNSVMTISGSRETFWTNLALNF